MKEIELTQGKVALVDDEDYEYLSQFKWCAHKNGNTWYATRLVYENGNKSSITMHRAITQVAKGMVVDHINHNGLDNRKENLRTCTKAENSRNRIKGFTTKSSKYKGVYFYKPRNKWKARIITKREYKYLGLHQTEEAAALAYNQAAKELHGEFALLNEV